VAAVVVAMSLAAGLLYFLWVADTSGHAAHNVAQGNRIVQALQAYEAAHGAYPASLRDLVPKFIEDIPKPERAEWIYEPVPDRARFMLCFEGGAPDAVGCYDSTLAKWQVDTK